MTQVEACVAKYVWFISYLDYGPGQTNFMADYSHTECTVDKVASCKGLEKTMFQPKLMSDPTGIHTLLQHGKCSYDY